MSSSPFSAWSSKYIPLMPSINYSICPVAYMIMSFDKISLTWNNKMVVTRPRGDPIWVNDLSLQAFCPVWSLCAETPPHNAHQSWPAVAQWTQTVLFTTTIVDYDHYLVSRLWFFLHSAEWVSEGYSSPLKLRTS